MRYKSKITRLIAVPNPFTVLKLGIEAPNVISSGLSSKAKELDINRIYPNIIKTIFFIYFFNSVKINDFKVNY